VFLAAKVSPPYDPRVHEQPGVEIVVRKAVADGVGLVGQQDQLVLLRPVRLEGLEGLELRPERSAGTT